MMYVLDPSTAIQDPFNPDVMIVFCYQMDPRTGELSDKDPRAIARNAELWLVDQGTADTANFGPEREFSILRPWQVAAMRGDLKGAEELRTADRTEVVYRAGHKDHYFPHSTDNDARVRRDMMLAMAKMELRPEVGHAEVAPWQHEIDIKYGTLLETADRLTLHAYAVREIAQQHGKWATFMPKLPPWIYEHEQLDNGHGMHVHMSFWKGEENKFGERGDNGMTLSQQGIHAAGGLLEHPELVALFAPTANCYRRTKPGFEAPVNIIMDDNEGDRSSGIRVVISERDLDPRRTRFEYRFPSALASLHLIGAGMIIAAVDGIKQERKPRTGKGDKYHQSDIPQVSGSLAESLELFREKRKIYEDSGIFTGDFIDWYDGIKREELKSVEKRAAEIETRLGNEALSRMSRLLTGKTDESAEAMKDAARFTAESEMYFSW